MPQYLYCINEDKEFSKAYDEVLVIINGSNVILIKFRKFPKKLIKKTSQLTLSIRIESGQQY